MASRAVLVTGASRGIGATMARGFAERGDRVAVHGGRNELLVDDDGVFEPHPITATTYDEWQVAWRRTMDVNLAAPARRA